MAQEKILKKIDGTYYPERWNVSSSTSNKANDGTYVLIGKRIRPL